MKNFLKNEKLWCVVAGAAAVIVGKKVFTSPKTRSVAVTGLAKGMKLQKDAKAKFQSMKDDAADLCYDAKAEAGIEAETETEATVEEVVAPAEQATTEETAVAEGDSTAVEAPAAETEAAPAE